MGRVAGVVVSVWVRREERGEGREGEEREEEGREGEEREEE